MKNSVPTHVLHRPSKKLFFIIFAVTHSQSRTGMSGKTFFLFQSRSCLRGAIEAMLLSNFFVPPEFFLIFFFGR